MRSPLKAEPPEPRVRVLGPGEGGQGGGQGGGNGEGGSQGRSLAPLGDHKPRALRAAPPAPRQEATGPRREPSPFPISEPSPKAPPPATAAGTGAPRWRSPHGPSASLSGSWRPAGAFPGLRRQCRPPSLPPGGSSLVLRPAAAGGAQRDDTPSRSALRFADTQPWPVSPQFPFRPLASKRGQFLMGAGWGEGDPSLRLPTLESPVLDRAGRGGRTELVGRGGGGAASRTERGLGTAHPPGRGSPDFPGPRPPLFQEPLQWAVAPAAALRARAPRGASARGGPLTGPRRRAGLFKRLPRSLGP